MVSSTGSVNRRRTLASTNATARPTRTPPPAARTKSRPTSQDGRRDQRAAASAVRRQTSAVASLTRLSPSRIGHHAARQADPPGDRGRGDGVRRRDHGAERERGPQRQRLLASDSATTPSSHHATTPTPSAVNATSPTDSSADRPPVLGEVDQAGLDRRRVEQRRQEADQDDLGGELDPGDEREVRRRDPDDHQQQGSRDPEPPGQCGPGRDHGDEGYDLDRDMHAAQCRSVGPVSAARFALG